MGTLQEQPRSPYLTLEEAAAYVRVAERTAREFTRLGLIPHRRPPRTRRCLFIAAELDAWLDGAPLEIRDVEGGGRVVSIVRGKS
jgi:excisionase family DNA binding protein